MLEPEIIRNRAFRTVKNGFDTAEVSSFLNDIANELENLLAENAKLEEQNKMLYDKVMEYREDEETIGKRLIKADKEAKKIEKEAKEKARDILDSARVEEARIREQSAAECQRIVDEHKEKCAEIIKQQTQNTQDEIVRIQDNYETEKEKFDKLRADVTYFKSELIELYQKQLALLIQMPQMSEEEIANYEDNAAAEYSEEDDAGYEEEYYDEGEYYDEETEGDGEADTGYEDEQARINRALDTHSFEPIIPKVDPSTLQFGNNTIY